LDVIHGLDIEVYNQHQKAAKSIGGGHCVEGILLEDGLTVKIGTRKDAFSRRGRMDTSKFMA